MRCIARALAGALLLLLPACAAAPPPPAPTATAVALAPTAAGLTPSTTPALTATAAPLETATAAPPLTPTLPPFSLPEPSATPQLPAELIDAGTAGRLAPLRAIGLGGGYGPAFTPDGEALVVATTAGLAWLRLPNLEPARLDAVGVAYEVALAPDGALLAHSTLGPNGVNGTALRRAADASLLAEVEGGAPRFSPDSRALVTSTSPYGEGQRAWLWGADGAPLAELAGAAPVWSPDGRFVATVELSYENPSTTRIYEADGAGPLLELMGAAPAFSPDGALVAVTAAGQVELYDLADAALRGSVPVADDAVSGFSADSARLLVVDGADLIVWDLAAGQELERLPDVNRSADMGLVEGLTFGPGGAALASLEVLLGDCPPGGVRVTATDDGALLYEDNLSYEAVFSGDGARLALSTGSGVRVVELASGAAAERALSAYEAVAFSPEGATLAASTVLSDGSGRLASQVELWDVVTSARRAVLATSPDDFVYSLSRLSFSPDGARLTALARYGCAAVGFIKLITWDVASGAIVSEIGGIPSAVDEGGAPTDGPPATLAFAPDGTAAAWVDAEQLILGRPDGAPSTLATSAPPTALAFSPDGARLVVGDASGNVSTFVVASGALMSTEPLALNPSQGPDSQVSELRFSQDGALLLIRTLAGRVIAVGDGSDPGRLQLGDGNEILGLSADNRYLIAQDEGDVVFCDLQETGCAGRLEGAATDAALGPGRRLIATLEGGRVLLWGVR